MTLSWVSKMVEICILHSGLDCCMGIRLLLVSRQFMSHECIDRWCLTVHGVHTRVRLSWVGRLEHALVLIRHWSVIQSLFVKHVLIA